MFYVRWSLIYRDGKKRHGLWNEPGVKDDPKSQAWLQPTKGLAWACVEALHIATRKTFILAECNGQDYCQFQWIGTVPLRGGDHVPKIRGMVLVSRDMEFDVYMSGEVFPRQRRNKDNLMINGREKQ